MLLACDVPMDVLEWNVSACVRHRRALPCFFNFALPCILIELELFIVVEKRRQNFFYQHVCSSGGSINWLFESKAVGTFFLVARAAYNRQIWLSDLSACLRCSLTAWSGAQLQCSAAFQPALERVFESLPWSPNNIHPRVDNVWCISAD